MAAIRRKLVVWATAVFATVAAPHSGAEDGASPEVPDARALQGLCSQSLAEKIAEVYAAQTDVAPAVAPQWLGGGTAVRIIPETWTGDTIADAYNILGASHDFIAARKDYIPSPLHTVTSEGKGWKAGLASIAGIDINAWTPDEDRRGDLARRLMYLATMYPHELWRGQAPMLMADGGWPLLTAYGSRILLQWHAGDPVDEREREENASTGARQGNVNPFVLMPELADHIWGDKAGEGFVPPVQRERSPLRSTYSRSVDGFIDLYSPYVAEDARWSLDGAAVADKEIDLKTLSNGIHTLSFTSGTVRGKVKIKICD